MTDIFSITYDNVDGLAAAAFAKSRMFAIAIRGDLLPNLTGDDLTLAEYLHVRIIQRRIFDDDILDILDALGERLEQLVLDGTQAVTRIDTDACNVSAASGPSTAERKRRTTCCTRNARSASCARRRETRRSGPIGPERADGGGFRGARRSNRSDIRRTAPSKNFECHALV